jgi:hypothetical protein
VPRCGALNLLQKPRGVIVVLRPLFAAALVLRRRYLIMVPRPLLAAPLVARRRHLIVVSRPMPAAPRMYLIVVYRPLPESAARCVLNVHGRGARADAFGRSFAVLSTHLVGLRLRLVVPRPMPAAVASRFCRRRFQQLACTYGTVGFV